MKRRGAGWMLGLLLLAWLGTFCSPTLAAEKKKKSGGFLNLQGKTLGGLQLWADELVFHEWRIQRHVYTGHCRLLDDENVRQAWGSFEHCHDKLEKLKRKRGLPPLPEKVVVILHGVLRTRGSMAKLGKYLEDGGGYEALYVSYPSTRGNLAQHAKSLARVVEHLHGVKEINFVAHSLGNLVIRHYLADQTDPERGLRPDARIKRIVMLAPPNNGAHMAEIFKNYKLMEWVWGKSIVQVADWQELEKRLATPQCQFGIIAGGRKEPRGVDPKALIKTDGDWVLDVEETLLPGARDFTVVPAWHPALKNQPQVLQYTLRFLQHGHFIAADKRRPIPPAPMRRRAVPRGAARP